MVAMRTAPLLDLVRASNIRVPAAKRSYRTSSVPNRARQWLMHNTREDHRGCKLLDAIARKQERRVSCKARIWSSHIVENIREAAMR